MKKINYDLMIRKAREAMISAYSPYSKCRVGACLLGESGKTFRIFDLRGASALASAAVQTGFGFSLLTRKTECFGRNRGKDFGEKNERTVFFIDEHIIIAEYAQPCFCRGDILLNRRFIGKAEKRTAERFFHFGQDSFKKGIAIKMIIA